MFRVKSPCATPAVVRGTFSSKSRSFHGPVVLACFGHGHSDSA